MGVSILEQLKSTRTMTFGAVRDLECALNWAKQASDIDCPRWAKSNMLAAAHSLHHSVNVARETLATIEQSIKDQEQMESDYQWR